MSDKTIKNSVIMSNIYSLAKDKGVKIGDLEKAANVSSGYLSRLNKDDNKSLPGVEVVYAIAQKLGVSVESILTADYAGMTGSERYILSFFEKMIRDTNDEAVIWGEDHTIDKIGKPDYDNEEPPLLKSVRAGLDEVSGYPVYEFEYSSGFESKDIDDVVLQGISYQAWLPHTNARVYLMNVQVITINEDGDHEDEALESYIYSNGKITPLCSTFNTRAEIATTMRKLYKTIKEINTHVHLTQDMRSVLDNYMEDKDPSDNDFDVPF
jgi:transcriptional regulator with XRE-family HTH domain